MGAQGKLISFDNSHTKEEALTLSSEHPEIMYLTTDGNIVFNNQIYSGKGESGIDVIDNLLSTSKTSALSANMGRALDFRVSNNTTNIKSNTNNINILKNNTTYNVSKVGDVQIIEGLCVNFAPNNYIKINSINLFDNYEIKLAIYTANDFNESEVILSNIDRSINIGITNNKLAFVLYDKEDREIILEQNGKTDIENATEYYIKFSYKNNIYKLESSKDNINYTTEFEITSNKHIKHTDIILGNSSDVLDPMPFGGIIVLNYSEIIVNNNIVWKGITVYATDKLNLNMNNIDDEGKQVVKSIVSTMYEFDESTQTLNIITQ